MDTLLTKTILRGLAPAVALVLVGLLVLLEYLRQTGGPASRRRKIVISLLLVPTSLLFIVLVVEKILTLI